MTMRHDVGMPASGPRIATLTVMRGEYDLLAELLPTIEWAAEHHIVETSPEVGDELSSRSGVQVHHHPLPLGASFEDARAAALPAIGCDWMLIIDTDEKVPDELARLLAAKAQEWDDAGICGVWLPRLNHVRDTPLHHSSAWPDYQLRFLKTSATEFSPILHSAISVKGETTKLPAQENYALQHFAFRSTDQFLAKLNLYSSIEAEQKGPATGGYGRALTAASRIFLVRFVKMRGFRDGWAGFHFCLLLAFYEYLIRVKQREVPADDS
jgi:hypothetical protein